MKFEGWGRRRSPSTSARRRQGEDIGYGATASPSSPRARRAGAQRGQARGVEEGIASVDAAPVGRSKTRPLHRKGIATRTTAPKRAASSCRFVCPLASIRLSLSAGLVLIEPEVSRWSSREVRAETSTMARRDEVGCGAHAQGVLRVPWSLPPLTSALYSEGLFRSPSPPRCTRRPSSSDRPTSSSEPASLRGSETPDRKTASRFA